MRALRERGQRVRAAVVGRRPRPELEELGAEVVLGELTQPQPWRDLLAGMDALYLIWPNFHPDEGDGAREIFAEARRAGLPRLVYHSVLRPQARVMPHHAGKDLAQEALDVSGVPWRVLQPCAYADNFDDQLAEAQSSGVLRSQWGLRQLQSLVDLRDVAEAAAVLLTEDGLDGGTFEAAGPEPLTAPRLAELMAAPVGGGGRAEGGGLPGGPPRL